MALEQTIELDSLPGVAVPVVYCPDQRYYSAVGFHLFVCNAEGQGFFPTDGGITDWTQRLLGNRKERLFVSGMGTERLVLYFRS